MNNFKFNLIKNNKNARLGRLTTAHGEIDTPVFMPVGTAATVKALKVNVSNVGDKTQLSIRPERVSIDSKNPDANIFTGKIEELIYLGDHIRARLDVCGNSEFIVKVPNEGSFSHKKGDSLNLSWNSDDVRALDL